MLVALLVAALPGIVRADGTLPPLPYRYLHPPAALKGESGSPFSGIRVLPVDYMRAVGLFVFTDDAQAGVFGHPAAFRVDRHATAVTVRVEPVEAPARLPSQVALDGNAYRFSAVEQPSNRPVPLAHRVSITLRWPHLPLGMYLYGGGTWRQLCYSDRAILTTSTITCSTPVLGIFAAVTNPAYAATSAPATPLSNSRFAFLNRYVAIAAAILLIAGAALALAYVSRRDRPASREP